MSQRTRYSFLLGIQIFLLLVDLIFNTLSEFARSKPELQLVVFIFQDVLIVLSLTAMLVSFFSTFIFQAGLVEMLFATFKASIITSIVYLITTIILHGWLLTIRWDNPLRFTWSFGITFFFCIQRFISPVYYYSTKRAILRVSDPRFYQNTNWNVKQ